MSGIAIITMFTLNTVTNYIAVTEPLCLAGYISLADNKISQSYIIIQKDSK